MTNAQSKLNFTLKTKYTTSSGFCWQNAKVNHDLLQAQGINCKIVAGSLGLNGHYEYGGKFWTLQDFEKSPRDSHVWVEDDEGNVYDYIYDHYAYCADSWNKKVTFPVNYEIKGISKKDLLTRFKLSYVAADEESQQLIKRTFYNPFKYPKFNL